LRRIKNFSRIQKHQFEKRTLLLFYELLLRRLPSHVKVPARGTFVPFWIEGGPGASGGDPPAHGEKYAAFIDKPVSQLVAWRLAMACSCATA